VEHEFPSVLASRFSAEELLGAGGLGAVWRARRRSDGRLVALKVLRPEVADDDAVRTRFEREGALAGQRLSPGLVAVVETGTVDGTAFIATELVEGRTLEDVLAKDGPLEPARVLALGRDLAACLAALHAAGVVHRDLKPGNVMIQPDGTVRLLDLGLARDTADGPGPTRTGVILGTPRYMAPEVCRGQKAGPAADVFALGMLLHDCLAPASVDGTDDRALLAALTLRATGRERYRRPAGCPLELWTAVAAMLANDPAERPADGRTAGAVLADARPVPTVATERPLVPRRSFGVPVAVAVLAVTFLLVANWSLSVRPVDEGTRRPLSPTEYRRGVQRALDGLIDRGGWTVDERRLRLVPAGAARGEARDVLQEFLMPDETVEQLALDALLPTLDRVCRRWAAVVELHFQVGPTTGPFDDEACLDVWLFYRSAVAVRNQWRSCRSRVIRWQGKRLLGVGDETGEAEAPPQADLTPLLDRIECQRRVVAAGRRAADGAGGAVATGLQAAALEVCHGDRVAARQRLARVPRPAAAAEAALFDLCVDVLTADLVRHDVAGDGAAELARLAAAHLDEFLASRTAPELSMPSYIAAEIWRWNLAYFFDDGSRGGPEEGFRRFGELLPHLQGPAFTRWRCGVYLMVLDYIARERLVDVVAAASLPLDEVPEPAGF